MARFRLFSRESTAEKSGTPITSGRYGDNAVNVTNETLAMKLSAVYRAVSIISNSIASMKIQYKRYSNVFGYYTLDLSGNDGRLMNYTLSYQANRRQNAFQFWRQVVCHILLLGNAYIYPRKNRYGIPEELILCTGSVAYDNITNTYTIEDIYNGISGTFPASDIIHLKNLHTSGNVGISTIAYAAKVLSINATSDEETLRRFATGGRFKAFLSNDNSIKGWGKYQDTEVKSAAELLSQALRGGDDIVSVPGDTKVTPISMSSADMQFLDSRKFTIREIARFFNVPASKLMDDSNTVYGTTEANNVAFYSEALQPFITDIEQELTNKLIGFENFLQYKFSFDLTTLFVLDRKGLAEWNKSRLETGQASVNDLRRENDVKPIDKGDDVYVSVNFAPVGSAKLNGEPSNTTTP